MKSDSAQGKAAFENKVHRMSVMLSRQDLRRENLSLAGKAN